MKFENPIIYYLLISETLNSDLFYAHINEFVILADLNTGVESNNEDGIS